MHCSKKLFLTGGTGLIGKELWQPLTEAGFEVYALSIDEPLPQVPHITWLKGNLFDEETLSCFFTQIQPQYLLNMAWCASGDYQTSNVNFEFVRAGLNLLKHFAENGGKRAVFTGTCLEYAPKDAPIQETDALAPASVYAYCKNALRGLADLYCRQNGIEFAYGRIFYVYGKNEHPKRLTAAIINRLHSGEKVQIKHAQLQKDYLYTKDIAAAFTALLNSHVTGNVNICSGHAVTLADFATAVAHGLGKEHLLDLQTLPTDQPPYIVGNNTRLVREVGFTPRYTLQTALPEILGLDK